MNPISYFSSRWKSSRSGFFFEILMPRGKIITEGTFDWFPPRNDPPEGPEKQFLLSMIFCLLVGVLRGENESSRDFYLPCKLFLMKEKNKEENHFRSLVHKQKRVAWTSLSAVQNLQSENLSWHNHSLQCWGNCSLLRGLGYVCCTIR